MHYHSGHNLGFNSFSAWIPDTKLSVTILPNDDSINPQAIAQRLLIESPHLRAEKPGAWHAVPGGRCKIISRHDDR
jgi:hypothetical protein